VPDEPAFLRLLALVRPGVLDRARLVVVGATVHTVTSPAIYAFDWRPRHDLPPPPPPPPVPVLADTVPAPPPRLLTPREVLRQGAPPRLAPQAALFGMEFVGPHSAFALEACRAALLEDASAAEVAAPATGSSAVAPVCGSGAGGDGSDGSAKSVGEDGGGEGEGEGASSRFGAGGSKAPAAAAPGPAVPTAPPHPPSPRVVSVVYVSRSDAKVRRVALEAKLLERLRAKLRRDGGSSGGGGRRGGGRGGRRRSGKGGGGGGEGSVADAEVEAEARAGTEAGAEAVVFDVRSVQLAALALNDTRALFAGADVVVGPHGAGLFNAPLFCRRGVLLIAFSLLVEHEDKEGNLVAACAATGIKNKATTTPTTTLTNYG